MFVGWNPVKCDISGPEIDSCKESNDDLVSSVQCISVMPKKQEDNSDLKIFFKFFITFASYQWLHIFSPLVCPPVNPFIELLLILPYNVGLGFGMEPSTGALMRSTPK